MYVRMYRAYSVTGKTVNTWNTSGMFTVLKAATAKIQTHQLATKPQTNNYPTQEH